MTTFREIENQSDNEIIALVHAGLHGHEEVWHEVWKRDQALFTCLSMDREVVDAYAFSDLINVPYAYKNLETARALGQSMLDDNINDCRSFRPVEAIVPLLSSEDLREFLLNQDLSDAVQLVEALGQLDDITEDENHLAYSQMMQDAL